MKKKNADTPPYYMVRFGTMIEEFQNEAAHFTHMMTSGLGLRSSNLLDSLRKMEQLYMSIVTYLDVAKGMSDDKSVVLEDALDALEQVRQLSIEAENEINEQDE